MRLGALDRGQSAVTRLVFWLMRSIYRQPVPGIVKLARYRPAFFGNPMRQVLDEAMRGPSRWSLGDRELMAAVVSQANQCTFCARAHAAIAVRYLDEPLVSEVLLDLDTATISEQLRATLRLLRRLTREHRIGPDDVTHVLSVGVSADQIRDALAVAFAFNTVDRLADSLGFEIPGPGVFRAGARFVVKRGYA